MKRAGRPNELAPCFVLLDRDELSCMTGQLLHPKGVHAKAHSSGTRCNGDLANLRICAATQEIAGND
jgi:hypothetical protein